MGPAGEEQLQRSSSASRPPSGWLAGMATRSVAVLPPGWSQMEALAFAYGFNRFGKQFHQIAKMLPGKRTRDVVAFYYSNKHRRSAGSLSDVQRVSGFSEFEDLAG